MSFPIFFKQALNSFSMTPNQWYAPPTFIGLPTPKEEEKRQDNRQSYIEKKLRCHHPIL
jgi:hypothetical protein